MAQVFIGVGSNEGDRLAMLDQARQAMDRLAQTRLVQWSNVYETDPVSPVPQGKYLNAAAELDTQLTPSQLLNALDRIEREAGREPVERRMRWGPRTLDLDILLFGALVISRQDLVIPHPLMHERYFVLKPLADLAPGAVHPLLEMTVDDLLKYLGPSRSAPPSHP